MYVRSGCLCLVRYTYSNSIPRGKKRLIRQWFGAYCQTFLGSCGSLYCDVLRCMNGSPLVFLVLDFHAVQYVAAPAAVLQISDVQKDTNISKIKNLSEKIFID